MLGNNWCNKRYFNRKNTQKNQVQNLLNLGVGLENFVISIRYSMKNLFNLTPNFKWAHNTRLSYNIPPIKVRNDFFLLLYQSGTSLASTLETQKASILFRSSHPKVFFRKGVLKICSKFTGEHPCRSAISIKLQSNMDQLHILRTSFPKNTSGRLLLTFKKNLINFIRPCANSIYDIHKPLGIKLLTRLCLGLSHPHEHRFRHCFKVL